MVRNYIKKNLRVNYSLDDLKKAVDAVQCQGVTLKYASETYGVPLSTLAKKYKKIHDNVTVGGGRKKELTDKEEQTLMVYLKTCSASGEGLTKAEVIELVTEYVKREKKYSRWVDGKGPGLDWFNSFMNRHPDLSMRKGELLSSQRVRGADPFVINDFYKKWSSVLDEAQIDIETDKNIIFNCDESSFTHDPKDVKVIAEKGKRRVSKNISGSGKKNTTVMACGAANGFKLPPLIIFRGKYVWSSWFHKDAYPGTCYSAQKKGWMEGSIFAHWFSKVFIKNIPNKNERNGKKAILLFDGAKFHSNLSVAKEAVENDVILVKLPPNMTHLMQPLDKTVFRPIKLKWEELMQQWNRKNPGEWLPNNEFAGLLGIVWEEGFKGRNLRSGFESTGLVPPDVTKFPIDAYDAVKWKRYCDIMNNNLNINPGNEIYQVSNSTFTPNNLQEVSNSTLTPDNLQEASTSTNIIYEASTSNNSKQNSSFELFIKQHLSENRKKISTATLNLKRKRLTTELGSVLTSQEAMQKMSQIEKELKDKQEKINVKRGKKIPISKSKSKYVPIDDESDDSSLFEEDNNIPAKKIKFKNGDYISSSGSELEIESDDQSIDEKKLKIDIKLESYYAIYYEDTWYLGRVIDFWDENKTKIKFMKKDLDNYIWPRKEDIHTVENRFIFYGPIDLVGNYPFKVKRSDGLRIIKEYKNLKKKT